MTHPGWADQPVGFFFILVFFTISSSSIPKIKSLLMGNLSEILGMFLTLCPFLIFSRFSAGASSHKSAAPMRSRSGFRHPATNPRKTFLLLKESLGLTDLLMEQQGFSRFLRETAWRRFKLDIREKFFTERVIKHRNRLGWGPHPWNCLGEKQMRHFTVWLSGYGDIR